MRSLRLRHRREIVLESRPPCAAANLMTVVVIGRESLDTLQLWVEDAFGSTPSLQVERPRASSATSPMAPSSLPMVLHVHPLEQSRSLSLVWYLPPQQSRPHLRCKPCDLIGSLVGHEGVGSILSYLKRRGLATELSAGVADGDSTAAATTFRVSIEMTRKGVKAVDEIVRAVFSYIGMLSRGDGTEGGGLPPKRIFDEMRDVAEVTFRFAEEEGEMDYARRLALSMQQRHTPSETLAADWLYSEWHPDLVQHVLHQLTPSQVILLLSIREDGEPEENDDSVRRGATGNGSEGDGSSSVGSGKDGAGFAGSQRTAASESTASAQLPFFPLIRPGGKRPQRAGGCMCTVAQRCDEHKLSDPSRDKSSQPETTSGFAVASDSAAPNGTERTWETEPWFEVKYAVDAPSAERVGGWQSAYEDGQRSQLQAAAQAEFGFCLPPPNEFIPSDFTLRRGFIASTVAPVDAAVDAAKQPPLEGVRLARAQNPPQLIHSDPQGCCFHKPDVRWKTPKAILWFGLQCYQRVHPMPTEHALLSSLAVDVTLQALVEPAYAASLCGHAYSVQSTWRGYSMGAAGFSHKLPALARLVCNAFAATAAGGIDAAIFDRCVESTRLSLQNRGHAAADRAHDARLECLDTVHYTPAEELAVLAKLTPAHLVNFMRSEFGPAATEGGSPFHLTCFAAGNVAVEEAQQIYHEAVSSFAAATEAVVSDSSIPGLVEGGMSCVVIEAEADGGDEAIAAVVGEEHAGRSQEPWPQDLAPDGCFLLQDVPSWHCHRVASTNAAESNVAVELYWQLGVESHELSARVALLCHLMYEPVFDQLRTKEQLG